MLHPGIDAPPQDLGNRSAPGNTLAQDAVLCCQTKHLAGRSFRARLTRAEARRITRSGAPI
jgi:hypothetical protein